MYNYNTNRFLKATMNSAQIQITKACLNDPKRFEIIVEYGTIRLGAMLMLGSMQVGRVTQINLKHHSVNAITDGYKATITLSTDLDIGHDTPLNGNYITVN